MLNLMNVFVVNVCFKFLFTINFFNNNFNTENPTGVKKTAEFKAKQWFCAVFKMHKNF